MMLCPKCGSDKVHPSWSVRLPFGLESLECKSCSNMWWEMYVVVPSS